MSPYPGDPIASRQSVSMRSQRIGQEVPAPSPAQPLSAQPLSARPLSAQPSARFSIVCCGNTVVTQQISETVAERFQNINWGAGRTFQLKGIERDFTAFAIAIK